mmetsp:Transcript_3446/g.10604  ORF Transcript_3446/g.10604 Transcript_3446/m.10604 type:complete len:88 (-) Transcript_3446:1418-1681(-)
MKCINLLDWDAFKSDNTLKTTRGAMRPKEDSTVSSLAIVLQRFKRIERVERRREVTRYECMRFFDTMNASLRPGNVVIAPRFISFCA